MEVRGSRTRTDLRAEMGRGEGEGGREEGGEGAEEEERALGDGGSKREGGEGVGESAEGGEASVGEGEGEVGGDEEVGKADSTDALSLSSKLCAVRRHPLSPLGTGLLLTLHPIRSPPSFSPSSSSFSSSSSPYFCGPMKRRSLRAYEPVPPFSLRFRRVFSSVSERVRREGGERTRRKRERRTRAARGQWGQLGYWEEMEEMAAEVERDRMERDDRRGVVRRERRHGSFLLPCACSSTGPTQCR